MIGKLGLLIGCSLLACAAHAQMPAANTNAAEAVADRPQIGTYGFDVAGMDRTIAPGDDFYGYANGGWAKTTAIPADRSNFGAFTLLDDLSMARSHDILEEARKDPSSKIGALYASFMDEGAVEGRGFEPVKPVVKATKAITTKEALAKALGREMQKGVYGPFAAYVAVDDKNPDRPTVSFFQAGLGLPDRDYYLKNDADKVKAREAYRIYLVQLLTLTSEPNAAARAQAVIEFETKIAQAHWSRIDSRDSTKTYNVWTRADFAAKAPGFDWAAFLSAAGLDKDDHYLVAQPSAFAAEARLIAATPVAVLRDHLLINQLDKAAPYLSRRFVDANFAFHGTALSGTPQIQERWKRGVGLLKDAMGEAVGQVYAARYFPPATKQAADQLVKNIIAAMDKRLSTLAWMDATTRDRARAKLASFRPKIGYPDKWRDYSALRIERGDLFGNVQRANAFEWHGGLGKLGKLADRDEWFMTPMEINAYANPTWNEIVFPAAILQPPFFDPKADPAINYGGIGAVIGHEMSHHFDDQGRKYDEKGRLADWWTPADVARFTALTDRLVKQYDAYEPLPGAHVQGQLTLGENMADLAGLTTAYDAYKLSLNGKEASVIDGVTGDQRFYLGWAQVWRRNYREANLRQRLVTDPHAPSAQRTDIVRNLAPWYDAFKPAPTTKLYLTPDQRVLVW